MRFFLAILPSALAAVTIVQAAPVNINQGLDKPSDANGKVVNYVSNEVLENHTSRSKYARRDGGDRIAALTAPVVKEVVDPLLKGIYNGIAGPTTDKNQPVDQLGDAVGTTFHHVGDVVGNTLQGATKGVSNIGDAIEDTLNAI